MKIEGAASRCSDSYDIKDFITGIELDMNKHPMQKLNLFRAKTEILYLKLKEYFGVEK